MLQPTAPGRQAAYQRARRQRKRQAAAATTAFGRLPVPRYSQDSRTLPPESTAFDAQNFATAGSGHWIGRRVREANIPKRKGRKGRWRGKTRLRKQHRLRELKELLEEGYQYIDWDGRNPLFILDHAGRIITIFVGTPDDPAWPAITEDAVAELERARRRGMRSGAFSEDDTSHRRGTFAVFTDGVFYGGGQMVGLHRHRSFVILTCAMANFAPKLYREYAATMQALFDHHPSLQRNFSNSVFPAASLNCGPETATFEHCDFNNIPHGLCGITCGGKFDHKKGAHLYLKQLKLVVEFPSGSSALIPSGAVDHGNTPLQPGDTRCSITQYAAGGLFRWVKYGFKTAKQLLAEDGGRN
ncbi:hypothetical protein B0H10DRAFT_2184035 [Mycena sp. CBHHK59/15]|nr:hypothetical protein B0H10DRAFT_2184035 [Mycena sp. CBHHK59/15]